MDSQSTVDHLRDEANARKNTTLGELLDTAAEELDEATAALAEIERLKKGRDEQELGASKQADKALCRKAREPSHFGSYVSDADADLMAVLKSGYPMHGSWGAKAADTIERLQNERDAWKEVADELGEAIARSIADFNPGRCADCGNDMPAIQICEGCTFQRMEAAGL